MSDTINIKVYDEAVDKIYALEKQVKELKQQLAQYKNALKPFANYALCGDDCACANCVAHRLINPPSEAV